MLVVNILYADDKAISMSYSFMVQKINFNAWQWSFLRQVC